MKWGKRESKGNMKLSRVLFSDNREMKTKLTAKQAQRFEKISVSRTAVCIGHQ